jgi:hypothetical protein
LRPCCARASASIASSKIGSIRLAPHRLIESPCVTMNGKPRQAGNRTTTPSRPGNF